MKKSFKKAIAILLSVIMIVCAFPMSAFAADAKKPNVTLQFGAMYASVKNRTMQNYMNGNPDNFAQSGLNSTDLEFANGTLTLKASSAKAQQTVTSNSLAALTADRIYKTGDFFTATVLLENVSKLAATQVAIKYSSNIAPAGYSVDDMSLSTDTDVEYSDYEPGVAIADQSANTLYNTVQTVGEMSYIDAETNTMYINVAVQDGSDYMDTSSTVFTDKAGKTINEFTNTAVLATFAFGIVGSGPISFSMADAENEENGFYQASVADSEIGTEGNYVTYAKTNEDGENGSAGMTFMGKNENVAVPTSTVTFIDANGATISATEYEVGATVTVPTLPTMTKDATNHYTYAWDKTPATVAGADDATYTIVKTATAHTWNAGVVTTEPTTTTDGVKTYTCTVCSQTKTEKIDKLPPAHVHEWGEWKYNGDASYTSKTVYKDGTSTRACKTCSETETKTIAGTGLLRVSTLNADFGGEIAAVFNIPRSRLAPFDEVYAEIIRADGVTVTIPAEDFYVNSTTADPNIAFNYGITPQGLNATFTFRYYATKNGETYWGPEYEYNMVEKYIKSTLSKAEAKTGWHNLVVEMVYYGAEAQKFTKWDMENPVTNCLTDAQKAKHSTEALSLVSHRNGTYKVVENPGVEWRSMTIVFGAGTQLKYRTRAYTPKDNTKVVVEVNGFKFEYSYAEEMEKGTDLFTSDGEGGLYFTFKELKTKYLRTPVYITFYEGDKAISNTYCYSAETYAQGRKTTSSDYALTQQLMRFGNAARVYFGVD